MSSLQTPATGLLFGLFTQAALYGIYVATLIHCLRWLVYTDEGWKQRDRVNKLMLIVMSTGLRTRAGSREWVPRVRVRV